MLPTHHTIPGHPGSHVFSSLGNKKICSKFLLNYKHCIHFNVCTLSEKFTFNEAFWTVKNIYEYMCFARILIKFSILTISWDNLSAYIHMYGFLQSFLFFVLVKSFSKQLFSVICFYNTWIWIHIILHKMIKLNFFFGNCATCFTSI